MTMAAAASPGARTGGMTAEERKVIFASSLGTIFEWYDFYLYGTLGADSSQNTSSRTYHPNVGFIFALAGLRRRFRRAPFRRAGVRLPR